MTSGFVYPVKHSHYYKAISHLITDQSKQKALEHIQGTLVFSSVCSPFCLWARHPGCLLCLLIPFVYIAVPTLLMCSIIYKTADLNIRWAIEQTSGSVTFSLGTAGWKPLWIHTLQKVLKMMHQKEASLGFCTALGSVLKHWNHTLRWVDQLLSYCLPFHFCG